MSIFSERLRRLREEKKPLRSMAITSQLMGLPADALRRYERGEAEPSLSSLGKIADYYHVSVDFLLGREAPKKFSKFPLKGEHGEKSVP